MKKYSLITLFLFLAFAAHSRAANSGKLQQALLKAVEKATPASVRIWGFDTVAKQQMSAQFSGVVVTADGYILTAAHVTIPGKTYKIMFANGKDAIAVALGKIELAADKTTPDVAMMKIIGAGSWPYAPMGSSAVLTTGEPCISIAYPEGLMQPKPSVRYGQVLEVKNQRGFIQSSCLMEPGDSGGPLFDLEGNVIGIHSAIEVSEAANYEVPVDLYRKYWSALKSAEVYTALPDPDVVPFKAKSELVKFRSPVINKKKLSKYCLLIQSRKNGKLQQAVGTLFSSAGQTGGYKTWIVSKSSLVGDSAIDTQTAKGKVILHVAKRDKNDDMVLLVPENEIAGGINLRDMNTITEAALIPGTILVSPLPDTASVFSVASTGIIKLAKMANAGFMGAAVNYKPGPMLITVVQPNSPADTSDIEVGDRVVSINNVEMKVPEEYGATLQQFWPGDTITMTIERASELSVRKIVLTTRPQFKYHHPVEFFAGGKSQRRDGFEQVFSHDAILTPLQFGGPVFDADGKFCGINIARYSRAISLVIPAEKVFLFFKREVVASTDPGKVSHI